jgi:hypothetical protein
MVNEANIEMTFQEIACYPAEWIKLARDRVLRVSWEGGNVATSWRKTLLQAVTK